MERPLISISIITYNQSRYVRDAVRGLLAQTYEPLEIIISDDHSTDDTWEIISAEVDAYKRGDGIHKNIVLNRNAQNMGIVAHVKFVNSLKHGVLSVEGAGDDISLPDRVSRIVQEWERTGRTATVVHHGYVEMDVDGNDVRTMPPRSAECALGATAAYATRVFSEFPPIGEKVTIEDQVWAKRALMLGPELRIPDVLVRYRVGCGVSTKFANERERMYKNAITMAQSCEQVLADLEMMKGWIAQDRYDEVSEIANRLYAQCEVDYKIVSGLPFRQRFDAVMRKYKQGRISRGLMGLYFDGFTYLQPWTLGVMQRRLYSNMLSAYGKAKILLTDPARVGRAIGRRVGVRR